MFNRIEYLASWVRVNLNKRLGKRGAEMTEYAIVLAVIAVLGIWFYYMFDHPASTVKEHTFGRVVKRFWEFIGKKIDSL